MINAFQGEHAFLSTFYDRYVEYEGITYRNAECAFQAQKTYSENLKKKFARLLPTEAIRRGRKLQLRDDWEDIKENVMYEINKIKFSNHELMQKLLATGNEELINNCNDQEWGVHDGKGSNKLGKILMKIRKELKDGQTAESKAKEEQSSDLQIV